MKKLWIVSLAMISGSAFAEDCSISFEPYRKLPWYAKRALKRRGYRQTDDSAPRYRAVMTGGCLLDSDTSIIVYCDYEISLNGSSYTYGNKTRKAAVLGMINKLPMCPPAVSER